MIVVPDSRIVSAISLGVFCRCAPSTSAIIRSMKVSPGLEVMRMTIRSESTLVPPVTALRSPPLSRMTGALSPVIADSSTRRDALDHLAVAGDDVARLADDQVALAQLGAGDALLALPLTSLRAMVSVLVLRSASACALPRPSAIASAKFAKSTVNQSQSVIWPLKSRLRPPVNKSRTNRKVSHNAAHFDHEHDRVLGDQPGIKLAEGVHDRALDDRRIEQRARRILGFLVGLDFHSRSGSGRNIECLHRHRFVPPSPEQGHGAPRPACGAV